MYGTYIGKGRMFLAPQWGGKLVASADDMSLVPDILKDGVFDIALTNFILRNFNAGMNVVDIGANLGYVTVLMGYKVGATGKVTAYEASPKNFAFLEQNVKMNYLRHVDIHNLAVYSEESNIKLYEPSMFMGSGSTKKDIVESFRVDAPFDILNEVIIPTVTIDSHLGNSRKIDFMKMDIEGGEYQAFLGMLNLIEKDNISVISFEMNSAALGEELYALKEMMRYFKNSKDARFYSINGEGNLEAGDMENLFSQVHVDNLVISFV